MTALTTVMITVSVMILSVVFMMMIDTIIIDISSYYFVTVPAIVKMYLL